MSDTMPRPDTEKVRAARLADWERRATPWLVVSAILPIVGAFSTRKDSPIGVAIGIACWLVFAADLWMHVRLAPGYLRTGRGVFDLCVVLVTFPWYLVTGGSSGFVTLARLARIARLAAAGTRSQRVKHLLSQLGSVAIYAGSLVLACSLVVKWAEPPQSGYATYGDAIWWGFVTITTVGYGDLYPVTTVGRISAVVLMLGGVAFLGTLAGTLSAFFGVGGDGAQRDDEERVDDGDRGEDGDERGAPPAEVDVASEIASMRATLDTLVARFEGPVS